MGGEINSTRNIRDLGTHEMRATVAMGIRGFCRNCRRFEFRNSKESAPRTSAKMGERPTVSLKGGGAQVSRGCEIDAARAPLIGVRKSNLKS